MGVDAQSSSLLLGSKKSKFKRDVGLWMKNGLFGKKDAIRLREGRGKPTGREEKKDGLNRELGQHSRLR